MEARGRPSADSAKWVTGGSSEGVLGHLWPAIGRLPRARRKRGGHRRRLWRSARPARSQARPRQKARPAAYACVTSAQVEAFTRPLRRDLRVRVKSLALKVRSSIPTACATRSRPDASYSTAGVGNQLSFRLIQDNQFVAKRVAYSRATADHYVEWGQNRLAPAFKKAAKAWSTSATKMSVSGPIVRCTTSSASVSGKPKPAASSLRHNSR